MATTLKRGSEVIWEELDGQALLVHGATGARWTLNAAALALWKLCDGTRSAAMLTHALSAATGLTLIQSREELERFALSLAGNGLLQGATISGKIVHFSSGGSVLRASFQGKSVGARRRPSPRGNSGPG